jgi:septation ring formation regulator EzrA
MSLLENVAKNFDASYQANTFQVDKIYTTWSICLKKKITARQKPYRKLTVLIEKKLENIHAKFETSPSKYSVTTSLGEECFEKFCTKGQKLLKLQLCKTRVVHGLKDKCIK